MNTKVQDIRTYKLNPGATTVLGIPIGSQAMCVMVCREDEEDAPEIGISFLCNSNASGSMRTFAAYKGNLKGVRSSMDMYVGSVALDGQAYHVFEVVLGG